MQLILQPQLISIYSFIKVYKVSLLMICKSICHMKFSIMLFPFKISQPGLHHRHLFQHSFLSSSHSTADEAVEVLNTSTILPKWNSMVRSVIPHVHGINCSPSLLLCHCDETLAKSYLMRKGFHLQVPGYSLSLRKVRERTQREEENMEESCSQACF